MQSVVVDENDNPVAPGVVGEMRIRGLGTTQGYWQKPAETDQVYRHGWYYPLDLCRVDEQGCICVVDCKKDMIVTGGENVSTRPRRPGKALRPVCTFRLETWPQLPMSPPWTPP